MEGTSGHGRNRGVVIVKRANKFRLIYGMLLRSDHNEAPALSIPPFVIPRRNSGWGIAALRSSGMKAFIARLKNPRVDPNKKTRFECDSRGRAPPVARYRSLKEATTDRI